MNKYKLRPHRLLVDLSILIIIVYLVLFIGVSAILNILILNSNYFKDKITNIIATKTNFIVSIDNIDSKFTYDYLPEIILNNVSISSKYNPKQPLLIKKLELNLSYSSLWKLNLIFNKIAINGTALNFTYNPNGDILLNDILITNLNAKKPANQNNTSNFDIENWLLQQHNITLHNIDISILDNKNNFKKILLSNINLLYTNRILTHRHLEISINSNNIRNNMLLSLNWNGGKLNDIKHWKSAHLQLKTYSNNSFFTRNLQQYFADFGLINNYNAKTVIDATLKNGLLSSLNANFNLTNLSYITAKNTNIINFPNIKGELNINLNKTTQTYNIKAESIEITTSDGDVIQNKQITGSYTIDKYGYIKIMDSNLSGINHLLTKFIKTKGLTIAGKINVAKISWNGNIFNPTNYITHLQFTNLGIKSQNDKIPQITNVSGEVNTTLKNGELHLHIESSKFIDKDLFYVPYEINHLNSKINWTIKDNKQFEINVESTTINAKDFNITTHGKYISKPNTAGYIVLYANLDSIPANQVGFYLPKTIDSANQWLQIALVGGHSESASLVLEGWLDDFPFSKAHGKFYIDANINNGRLQYVKGWPTIDNVYGKFMIRNQQIIIIVDKAKVNGNSLTNAKVTIPDMTADKSYLIGNAKGSGSTQNFLNYLTHTPINKMLGNLPRGIKSKGNGKVDLFLKVPFDKPENTEVKGTYTFINNSLKFNSLPVPNINQTNGTLNFTNNSVFANNINANTLDGKIALNIATNNNNGLIDFKAKAKSISYSELAKLYLPIVTPIINGTANTNIEFTVGSGGINNLSATSNLYNVMVNTPPPLQKGNNESSFLNFYIQNQPNHNGYLINFNYDGALDGKININQQSQILGAIINIPSRLNQIDYKINDATDNLPAVTRINAKPESFELITWLQTIQKLFLEPKNNFTLSTNNKKLNDNAPNNTIINTTPNTALPIDITLKTPNFTINDISFGKAYSHTYVTESVVAFNINSRELDGYGVYLFPKNSLDLYIYFANINKSFDEIKHKKFESNPNLAIKQEPENSHTNAKKNPLIPYILEAHATLRYINANNFESMFKANQEKAETYANATLKQLNLPTSHFNVNNLYLNGNNVGNLDIFLKSSHNNLIIESALWKGKYSTYWLTLTNYCATCSPYNSLVDAQLNVHYDNLGNALSNIKFNGIIAQGSGDVKAHAQWRGEIKDFNLKTVALKMDIDLKNGRFLKIDTGNLLGSILGIINLQTIVNLASFNFKDIFANGFAFDKLEARVYMLDNILYLKYLYMSSTLAVVGLKGHINLNDNTINMYLNITPSLGVGVAVGAGIITLNPIIGVATYLAEIALQNPVNKLFAFTFHMTGLISNPKIEQISVSKQITKNISSTVGK